MKGAFVVALILTVLAIVDKHFSSTFIFALMLYLILAAIVPYIMVPIGVVAIVWLLYTNQNISKWLASFRKG